MKSIREATMIKRGISDVPSGVQKTAFKLGFE